ncbi:hypothetical protein EC991_006473 [Linnemannia zychae]|nr:hypothetical protein EC991_006473 [Linnemannia zychae]
MVIKGNRRLVLAATVALAITSCSFTPSTVIVAMAQVKAPTPVQDMSWARCGSDLFIEGGYVSVNGAVKLTSPQHFALDLSTSWPVASPPWRSLSNGTPSRTIYSVCLPNNQTTLTFKFVAPSSNTITRYNANTDTWSPTVNITNIPDIQAYGLPPVIDPTSGLVYIAGKTNLNIYDPATLSWTQAPSGNLLTSRYFGSVLYNTARKSIMYVNGYNYGVNPTHFDTPVIVVEYSIGTAVWSTLPTSGSPPSPSADLCSAISEDGKTLVVFGGRTSVVVPVTFTGAIHILDIPSGVWSAGPPQSVPRIYTACVLVGDQFVAWGGSNDANNTLTSVEPIVYDVTLRQWANSYKAPAYYLNNPPTKPGPTSGSGGSGGSGPGSGGSGGSNGGGSGSSTDSGSATSSSSGGLGPIIGGVAGGLVVIGAIVGFLIYRRRQNKRLEEVKEQVSQQRMVIEAERSNNNNNNGNTGNNNTAINSSNVTAGPYPPLPAYSPNSNSDATTPFAHKAPIPMSPQVQHKNQFAVPGTSSPIVSSSTISSPTIFMASPATTALPASNSFYHNDNDSTTYHRPQPPQPMQKAGPHAVQMYQSNNGILSEPKEYYPPRGRAPQTFNDEDSAAGLYREQESVRRRQNHPQGGGQ